ncbi:hypothetical protein [Mammaliicoccus sciuri]|uniref:Uncharacterized protein n=1 Tax=Mammaliicoccus sciuri TaxID=1296 RepID=A0AAI8GV33_MAMSC|nr:hypothetical protein [Mammaliicoccus sciuri]ASE35690.1 hypothetical protein CEP64_13805 [Mammaliicoccus sciuri]
MINLTLKEKDMKEIVQSHGIDYQTWAEQVVNEKRLQIIDKDKTYFNAWRENVLKEAVLSLVLQNVKGTNNKTGQNVAQSEQIQKNKHQQA